MVSFMAHSLEVRFFLLFLLGSLKYLNMTGLINIVFFGGGGVYKIFKCYRLDGLSLGGLTQILFKIVMDKSFSLFSDGFKDGRL